MVAENFLQPNFPDLWYSTHIVYACGLCGSDVPAMLFMSWMSAGAGIYRVHQPQVLLQGHDIGIPGSQRSISHHDWKVGLQTP